MKIDRYPASQNDADRLELGSIVVQKAVQQQFHGILFMARPRKPDPFEPLPPEERVLQIKSRIGAEESIAQAKKMFLRLLIGGLVLGVISSIAVVKLIALLDKTFDTDFAPPHSPGMNQNR